MAVPDSSTPSAATPSKTGRHHGRRYAIVGGTSGMGRAAAQLLFQEGALVAVLGRDRGSAISCAEQIDPTGRRLIGDGGMGSALGRAIGRAAENLGGLDGIAVTAGPIHSYGGIGELADEAWAEAFDTQLMTVVRSLRAAIPLLEASGGGSIVTVAAQSIRLQKASLPHYAAMKSAVASLTKNVAKFHGSSSIRANCIAPGAIATEALDGVKAQAEAEYDGPPQQALWRVMQRSWGTSCALDRMGEPPEVADLIAFLLSREAGYLTGALINIDGGSDF